MDEKKSLHKPFISIITVCLNEVKSINKTIQSIISQKSNNYEWIVIDGGSTDGTLNILRQYKKNIKILISEKDTGIYNAMNKGIALAAGEYLLFINGGDSLYNDLVIQNLYKQKFISSIIIGNIVSENDLSKLIHKRRGRILSKFYLLEGYYTPHQATLIKRELFSQYGLYNEDFRFAADNDFITRMLVKEFIKVINIDDIIAIINPNGVSNNKNYYKSVLNEFNIIKKKYYNILIRIIFFLKRKIKRTLWLVLFSRLMK